MIEDSNPYINQAIVKVNRLQNFKSNKDKFDKTDVWRIGNTGILVVDYYWYYL